MPQLKYEHALGLVTRRFQELELYLSVLAWGLMGKDQRIGQAITSQMSFSKLLVLVSTLLRAKARKRSILERFKVITRQATDAEQKRNRVIHSAYLQVSDDQNAKLIRYKIASKLEKGLVVHWEAMGFDEIMDVAIELTQTLDLLTKFIKDNRESLGLDYSGYSISEAHLDEDVPF